MDLLAEVGPTRHPHFYKHGPPDGGRKLADPSILIHNTELRKPAPSLRLSTGAFPGGGNLIVTGGWFHGESSQGCPLRASYAPQEPRLHHRCSAVTRFGHRREHRHLQHGQRI